MFYLENLCLDSLNSFLVFPILALEKFVFSFVSSKLDDSDSLRALSSFRYVFIAFDISFFFCKFASSVTISVNSSNDNFKSFNFFFL